MLYRYGWWIQSHRWWVIGAWVVMLAASVPLAPRLPSALKVGGFSDDTLESARARQTLQQQLGYQASNFQVIFQSDTLDARDPRFIAQSKAALEDVAMLQDVAAIAYHDVNGRQISRDGHSAYEVVTLTLTADDSPRMVHRLKDAIHPTDLRVLVAGAPVFYSDIESVSSEDLRRAETVAFPFAIVVLLLVFGSAVAASVPAIAGGASVAVSLAVIYGVTHITEMSIFVLNVTTMIGLGLGVDYSLFMTSRFREEIEHRPIPEAVAVTVATAGQAVLFSGGTVCLGLLALVSFSFMMLRSVGIGGSLVVAFSVLAALTLLPAVLAALGPRINAFRLLPGRHQGGQKRDGAVERFWAGLAGFVMRHPMLIAVPVLTFLLILGSPFLRVHLSSPDASILPTSVESRRAFDILQQQFNDAETAPILIAAQLPHSALDPVSLRTLYDFTHRLQHDGRVKDVVSLVTIDPRLTLAHYTLLYADPGHIGDQYAQAAAAHLGVGTTTLVTVTSLAPPSSEDAKRLVRDIRLMAHGMGLTVLVDGAAAEINDVVARLYSEFPPALAFILVSTYVVLLLLFRSVLLPLKALVMNGLSILGAYGALVFVFQDGHLSGLFHFTPLGYVEASLPILMFCTLFGLSMDYEVFLLSRIQEAYARTGDNRASVSMGLRQSGRIITSAAAIVVLVAGSFVMADIILIKALGLGVAMAVFLDATVVRALLVPATMRLLGDLNWWAPAWLRTRLPGLREERDPMREGTESASVR